MRDGSFDARIVRSLLGDTGGDIAVSFSTFDATEPRWAPYDEGQTLVLFLKQEGAGWTIAGMSGEGELPVQEGFVYITGHFVPGLEVQRYPVGDAEIASQRIALAVFEDALAGFFRCFDFAAAGAPRAACDADALSDYASRSPLHGYLAKALR